VTSEQTGSSTDLMDDAEGDAPAARSQNPYTTMLAILGGGLAMALVIIAVGFAVGGGDGGGEGGSSAAPVPVQLSEFAISGSLEVAPGGTLAVTNEGTQVHNLVIDGDGQTADLASGESEELVVDVAAGEHVVFCSIPGHREAGMEATMTVAEGVEVAAGAESPSGGDSSGSSSSEVAGMDHANLSPEEAEKLDTAMTTSFQPFVDQLTSGKPNTEGLGGQDLVPTIAPDGAKVFDITTEIVDWEVSPGQIVKAWTYNGTVPGPTMRGEVGDRIRINLTNDLPLATDLHMHGMVLPNDQDGVSPLTQDAIEPGETYTYEYVVTEPAIAMYHPHIHGMQTIPDGMWGAMIFSPAGGGGTSEYTIPYGKTVSGKTVPADLKVAQEHNMVLNDAGVIGLSLNGKSFPATEPYAMKQGEWMLVNYYNEGTMYHPMHLHQFPQLVVARDGIPLDFPYWADTVSVGPGERYTVLFQAAQTGAWVWHCHILNHAEREEGMFGMVTAVAVTQ
jgi:FtsP/CotA-like multicopper oxidase with cupredoxin domain